MRSGTTRFWDMYWHPEATARAVADAGIRATIGAPLFDLDGSPARLRETAHRGLEELAGFGPEITPALAPHAIYTVSEESLRWIAELSAERDLPVQIHLSETEEEVQDCLAAHGVRPAFYLDRLGLLSERTVLAHGVWLDPEELALIAERGATVVTNPVANMKLAVGGVFPYPAARAAGVAVGLGTDGAGSNDSLDLLADLKIFALAQKHAAADPTAIEAARGLGRRHRRPRAAARRRPALEAGAAADFLLLRAERAGAGDRRPHRRPRLRRQRCRRRHHRRRRPGADARRRDRGLGGNRGSSRRARGRDWGYERARQASSVRYEETTKRYGDAAAPGGRPADPRGPGGRDLRPRRPLRLRQDDGDADGQPHGRDHRGRRPRSATARSATASRPSCGGRSAT